MRDIWRSFPLRLLVGHLKNHLWLMLPWFLLFLLVNESAGVGFGVPYLFLDPQYAGSSNYLSFTILGFCFGGFYVTWNIVSYMLDSWKYPFMASLKWPVTMYFINNAPLPLAFLIFWMMRIARFQGRAQFEERGSIALLLLGMVAGILLALLITALYFTLTNKDIFGYIRGKKAEVRSGGDWLDLDLGGKAEPISFFISRTLRPRPVREVKHYDDQLLRQVFRQHHLNTFLLQIVTIAALIVLGLFIDRPILEIPAAGSVLLFFSFLIALFSFFQYWAGPWSTLSFVLFILATNWLSSLPGMNYESRAFGLDYEAPPARYDLFTLSEMVEPERVEADRATTLSILENWRRTVKEERSFNYKPKMVFITSTGGGLRSAVFTMKVLQTADSITHGGLMDHCAMMTGASGGTFGVAYYRELALRRAIGLQDSIHRPVFLERLASDQLNKWATAAVTNDLFVPIKKREILGYEYRQDRGMFQEIAFAENIRHVMDKPVSSYRSFEQDATIPLLIIGATSTNDARQMLISAQPVSYLMTSHTATDDDLFEIDAVDLCAFLGDQDGDNLGMMSALRMNASFPLVLPAVTLPTDPRIEVMDAGARDNYGMLPVLRFIDAFQPWIERNTSGVVIVQIRGNRKLNPPDDFERRAYLTRFLRPLGVLYDNLSVMQDYGHDYMVDPLVDDLDTELEIVRFEYDENAEDEKASMSLHLTEIEKRNLMRAARNATNQESYDRLQQILQPR